MRLRTLPRFPSPQVLKGLPFQKLLNLNAGKVLKVLQELIQG